MKKLILLLTTICFLINTNLVADNKDRSLLEKVLNRDLPGGAAAKSKKEKLAKEMSSEVVQDFLSAFPDAKLVDVTEDNDA